MDDDTSLDGILAGVCRGEFGDGEAGALLRALQSGDSEAARQVAAALERQALLFQVVRTVSEAPTLDAILPRLIDLITVALAAERATLFLHDPEAGELFSRVAHGGSGIAEIRVRTGAGIAGSVFLSGRAEIIADAYADPRFNQEVDRQTGFRTRSVLAAPVRNRADRVIGVTQVLNKQGGTFTAADLALLEAIGVQAAAALEQARLLERVERARRDEAALLDVAELISSELDLDALLPRIVTATTRLLDAERSTLFLYDPRTHELWSRVAEGADVKEIRVPTTAGVAGAAFTAGKGLNIADAYADPRFNQEVDRRTGYRTRSILAMPVNDRLGSPIGVVQVLNRRGGPFGPDDERRLRAFTAQIGVALQNAQLFTDVLALKNYNEGILKSLSNGVVTLDAERRIIKVNEAAERILRLPPVGGNAARTAATVFGELNGWLLKSLDYVAETGGSDYHADVDYKLGDGEVTSVNLTAAPLVDTASKAIGHLLVFEDITREKRVRSTMARYMAKEVVDRLLAESEDVLKGATVAATVLFSDIRKFTTLAESMSARETVQMLNDYFTDMVEVVFRHGGVLDKYIGDAIMAIFGAPLTSPDDADNALTVANEMLRALGAVNQRRASRGLAGIEIGVGLATGDVLAGSIGSEKRLDYTVIGDSVNLASRLEGANKYYGSSILVASSTVDALKRPHRLRRIDMMRVRGKSKPTEIFEGIDHLLRTAPAFDRVLARYEEGLSRYRSRDWTAAAACFAAALDGDHRDGPSAVYLDRCRYYAQHPPADDWDGVWTLAEK